MVLLMYTVSVCYHTFFLPFCILSFTHTHTHTHTHTYIYIYNQYITRDCPRNIFKIYEQNVIYILSVESRFERHTFTWLQTIRMITETLTFIVKATQMHTRHTRRPLDSDTHRHIYLQIFLPPSLSLAHIHAHKHTEGLHFLRQTCTWTDAYKHQPPNFSINQTVIIIWPRKI